MGKKIKDKNTGTEDIKSDRQTNKKRKNLNTMVSNADIIEPVHKKRNKKHKKKVANDAKQDSEFESKQTNKIDKHLDPDNADVSLVNEPTIVKKTKTKNKGENDNSVNQSMAKNKKIIFNDDGHVQDSSQISNDVNVSNSKQFLSGEDAVTEEEIDRFCDELDEEDNVQFDSWVKLIEEKLNPTKKIKLVK